MKLTKLIAALEKILAEHGDLECNKYDQGHYRDAVPPPSVSYRLKITVKTWSKSTESKPRFWAPWDDLVQRGEKVVRL